MYRDGDERHAVVAVKWLLSTFKFKLISAGALGSLLLAVAGPFDTYSRGSFGVRLVFWGGVVAISILLASIIKPRVVRRMPNNILLREAVILSIFLPIFLPALIFWINIVLPDADGDRTPIWLLSLHVLVISVIVGAALHLIPAMIERRISVPRTRTAGPAPRLNRRLPGAFGGRVLRLTGDGHFVKVVTTEGTYDIRMRLRDAVDEMDGVPGFLSHRSHWVATQAIHRWMMHKGRPQLVLSNGDIVPVGAKYQPELEAAGFDFARGIETENV